MQMRMSLLGGLARAIVIGTASGWVSRLLAENVKLHAGKAGHRLIEAGRRGRRRMGRMAMDRTMDRMELACPMTPAGAVARGVVAGAAGSFVQTAFFKVTGPFAPPTPEGVFLPPEQQQRDEQATQTVARRLVEGLMQRGPIHDKRRAGEIVHYAFGAAWGGVYGLIRGTTPAVATPAGVAAFGTAVWLVSDNMILPAFKLSARPGAYSPRTHAYAWAAHLVYAAAVAAAFEAQRRATWIPVVAAVGARWATRRLPAPLRPSAARILTAVRSQALRNAAQNAAATP